MALAATATGAPAVCIAIATAVVFTLLLASLAQALDIETLALDSPATGVPGLPGDARFSYFGYDPVIADTGQVAFQAKLVRGPGGVTAEDDTGIWATDPLGALQLVAWEGHQAPGTPDGALFEELFDGGYSDSSSPILSGSGHLAFMAPLRVGNGGVTSANDLGIWALAPGGELELVVRKGDPPPGLGSSEFTGFFAGASLNDAGEIAFRAFLPSRGEGIWGPDGAGGLMPVALKEGPVPGVTGATFALFRQPALSDSGGVAFRANMAQLGSLVTAADDLAIWGPDATGALALRAREGRAAPGAPAGALFDHLEDPFVDASGEVAFRGRLRTGTGGVIDENDAGVWGPDGSGALTLLAREGDLAPGAVGALLFREFRDLRLNDAGDVAFVAEMDLAPGGELTAGLFVSDGAGGIRLLTQEGQQAPDLPDGVVFDWLYDGNLALNDLGDVAFLARLAGPGVDSSNWLAVFFAPLGGDVSLLVRERDTVEVVPGVFKPVFVDVSDLSGRTGARGLSNARQLSSYGSIRDWTSDRAVFRTTLPEPPEGECNDGVDNDGDGLLDIADPGCQHPLDPFETNCGSPVPFTSNETEDAAPTVSESRIAWHQWDGSDFEVLLSDGLSVNSVTNSLAQDTAPSIAGASVAWEEWGSGQWRIMLWEGLASVPLSDAGVDAWAPDTDGSGVVWSQGPSRFDSPEGIYHWDGSATTRVFGSTGGIEPAISGERIVWESDAGIHIWTGSTTVLIPGSQGGHAPAISGNKVVWHASDSGDDEVFLWNESTTQQLTDNDIDDRNADVSGNRVVWESDAGIEVWQSGETSLLTGSAGRPLPRRSTRSTWSGRRRTEATTRSTW